MSSKSTSHSSTDVSGRSSVDEQSDVSGRLELPLNDGIHKVDMNKQFLRRNKWRGVILGMALVLVVLIVLITVMWSQMAELESQNDQNEQDLKALMKGLDQVELPPESQAVAAAIVQGTGAVSGSNTGGVDDPVESELLPAERMSSRRANMMMATQGNSAAMNSGPGLEDIMRGL